MVWGITFEKLDEVGLLVLGFIQCVPWLMQIYWRSWHVAFVRFFFFFQIWSLPSRHSFSTVSGPLEVFIKRIWTNNPISFWEKQSEGHEILELRRHSSSIFEMHRGEGRRRRLISSAAISYFLWKVEKKFLLEWGHFLLQRPLEKMQVGTI